MCEKMAGVNLSSPDVEVHPEKRVPFTRAELIQLKDKIFDEFYNHFMNKKIYSVGKCTQRKVSSAPLVSKAKKTGHLPFSPEILETLFEQTVEQHCQRSKWYILDTTKFVPSTESIKEARQSTMPACAVCKRVHYPQCPNYNVIRAIPFTRTQLSDFGKELLDKMYNHMMYFKIYKVCVNIKGRRSLSDTIFNQINAIKQKIETTDSHFLSYRFYPISDRIVTEVFDMQAKQKCSYGRMYVESSSSKDTTLSSDSSYSENHLCEYCHTCTPTSGSLVESSDEYVISEHISKFKPAIGSVVNYKLFSKLVFQKLIQAISERSKTPIDLDEAVDIVKGLNKWQLEEICPFELDALNHNTVKHLHTDLLKDLCKDFGSVQLIKDKIQSERNIFETATIWFLQRRLSKYNSQSKIVYNVTRFFSSVVDAIAKPFVACFRCFKKSPCVNKCFNFSCLCI
ncbi:uncharacterized protein LOC124866119 [Girardinichthys multiradiatus]|uniref:uncharacterized protein LOC124866119 n=1 Tax=Girardinichthys multiradiatus TaxID=208333 RepID=UPI001FAD44ED|nr:uncharacterized protein LOC124866119 [Girardinichthys multiradiatus]